jgi:anti-anti-sigma regulatory factor
MNINITKTDGSALVTILHLDGTLDGSNASHLVDEAQKVYSAGALCLILDLSKLVFISSAGLAAMHQVALLFRGRDRPGMQETWGDYRWAAFRHLDPPEKNRFQENVKLFSPTRQVREILDLIGFSSLFEIYSDLKQATASFHHLSPAAGDSRRL